MVVSHKRPDVLRSLLSVVKGHLAEEVVAHVGVSNVVDDVVDHWAERPVNSAECSPEPIPLAAAKVRHENVRVLEECDEHQVCVGDHVRGDVVLRHGLKAESVDGVGDACTGCEESKVGGDDVHAVALCEHLMEYSHGWRSRFGGGSAVCRQVVRNYSILGVRVSQRFMLVCNGCNTLSIEILR